MGDGPALCDCREVILLLYVSGYLMGLGYFYDLSGLQLGLPSWQVFLLAEVDRLPAVCPVFCLGIGNKRMQKKVGLVCEGQR